MITIKGHRQGLLIVPSDGTWHEQLRELETKLNNSANFFKGGRVALDLKTMPLSRDDLERAQSLLRAYDVQLWAVLSQHPDTNSAARALGLDDSVALAEPSRVLPKRPPNDIYPDSSSPRDADATGLPEPEPVAASTDNGDEGTDGVMTRRRVRSGQVIRHPGHIVVIGDVNPGAQIIAGGDIIVWGKLQGSAHAGALGDAGALVGALSLQPSTLRIADTQLIRAGTDRKPPKGPHAARIIAETIVISAWQEK